MATEPAGQQGGSWLAAQTHLPSLPCLIQAPNAQAAGAGWALDVSSDFSHSSGTSGCANKNNNKKKRALCEEELSTIRKRYLEGGASLLLANELLQVTSSCSGCSAVAVLSVVTSLMGPAWAGQELCHLWDCSVPTTQLHPLGRAGTLSCHSAEQGCQVLGHLSSCHSAGEPGCCRWGRGTGTQMLQAAAWAAFKGLQQGGRRGFLCHMLRCDRHLAELLLNRPLETHGD